MKPLRSLLLVTLTASLAGCMAFGPRVTRIPVDPHSEAGVQLRNLDALGRAFQSKPLQEKARRTAEEFVSHAIAGDVAAMMRLTSPLCLEVSGKENVERIYTQDLVRLFRGATVTWHPGGNPLGEGGFSGYEVSCTVHGRTVFPFYMRVFQEHGRFVIGSVAKTPTTAKR